MGALDSNSLGGSTAQRWEEGPADPPLPAARPLLAGAAPGWTAHTAVVLGVCPAGLGRDDPREAVSTGAELRSKPGIAPDILAEVLRVLEICGVEKVHGGSLPQVLQLTCFTYETC